MKTTEFTENVEKYITNLFIIYINKLKLISKHTFLYNGKKNSKENEQINKNSKMFFNKDLKSKILEAKTEEINKIKHFNKLFNTNTGQFEYFEYFQKILSNITDENEILNKLQKEENILNYISYHNNLGQTNIDNLDEETLKKLNYIIPIFKSIYLERFMAKKSLMDILRIYILNHNELILYPPEDYRRFNLILFRSLHPGANCLNTDTNFYSCVYDYIIKAMFNQNHFVLIILEAIYYQTFISSFCIRIPFIKDNPDDSIICLEIDFEKIISSLNFYNAKNFNFGLYNPLEFDINLGNGKYHHFKDIYIIGNTFKDAYNEFHKVFNSYETTPFNYVLDEYKPLKYYSLYHFMHLETTKIIKEHPELNLNVSKLEEEYEKIKDVIFKESLNRDKKIAIFQFNRTTCRKELIGNNYECYSDEVEMNLIPLILKLNKVNENFVETNELSIYEHGLYIYSIIYTNPETNRRDIKSILLIKLIRIIILYLFLIFIIISLLFIFINLFSSYSFDNINNLINSMEELTADDKKGKINLLNELKSWRANDEMTKLNDIYDLIRKSLIIKEAFDDEKYIQKNKIDFYLMVQDIKNKRIKVICNSLLGINHFNDNINTLAEKEILSTLDFIKENERKLKIEEGYDKIKDAIKRSSIVSYLNEYSNFESIDENMLDSIYINIYKQRFIYLFAMIKFKLGEEINVNKNKKNKDKKENYFKDAIKYFKECKDINELLGINQIKIIYSLIMISKCYLHLNDYKNSIININEALSLYFNFSLTFNNNHSKYYNSKIMLFIETSIFHYILFTFSRICFSFNKHNASNYITLKIFETSPFILPNMHLHLSLNLLNYFDKNKTKASIINKFGSKISKSTKENEKLKKYYSKIVFRLFIKNYNENIHQRLNTAYKISENKNTLSINNQTIKESIYDKSRVSSNIKRDFSTTKISNLTRFKKLYKNITLCLSEKILKTLNEQEFKDVIIKYYKKYFIQDENDKFSYIQFATNGKKTLYFQPSPLNEFITKFQKSKYSIDSNNDPMINQKNKASGFLGLYDIFDSVIKNYQTFDFNDNIILLFIASEDIRFSTVVDCINIVEELNKKNISVYFLCNDEIVDENKINNIKSFLDGLIEGYFFHIKNYEQIKEIFVNISNLKCQSNFFKFNYYCFDNNL